MNRRETLEAAAACVLHDRNDTYGPPEDGFTLIAALWRAYLRQVGTEIRPPDVAAMMVLLKAARLAANSGHADSWVDLAGYAACGAELATGTVDLGIEASA